MTKRIDEAIIIFRVDNLHDAVVTLRAEGYDEDADRLIEVISELEKKHGLDK